MVVDNCRVAIEAEFVKDATQELEEVGAIRVYALSLEEKSCGLVVTMQIIFDASQTDRGKRSK